MDTRDWTIYDNREAAEQAGVPDECLVTGSRDALEKLKAKFALYQGLVQAGSVRRQGQVSCHTEDCGKPECGVCRWSRPGQPGSIEVQRQQDELRKLAKKGKK
jgi:hypothetical protein